MNVALILEATLVIAVIGLISAKLKLLDRAGGIASSAIGYAVYLSAGRVAMLILIAFLVIAGLATRYKRDYKRSIPSYDKSVTRGWRNVVGNGIVPATAAVLSGLSPDNRDLYMAAFVGAVSAVFADTMATEIGLLYRGRVRTVIGLRETKPGLPGGVTPLGLLGSLISSVILVTVLSLAYARSAPYLSSGMVAIVVVPGVVGMLVDSVAGQLLQAVYRCERCGAITESESHCDGKCTKVKGYRAFNNHTINAIASAVGAILAIALSLAGLGLA